MDLQDSLYARLLLPPLASLQDVRLQYKRLALSTHPDKATSDPGVFQQIAEAYAVLSDPEQKRSYDAWLQAQTAAEPHFTIDLDKMTEVCVDDDPDPVRWTYPCRCGSEYAVDRQDLEQGVNIVQCAGCSLRCRIVYYVIDDNEEQQTS
ncbi:hypothetical protein RI367_006461 [Sorochytrium milnesiophthora]